MKVAFPCPNFLHVNNNVVNDTSDAAPEGAEFCFAVANGLLAYEILGETIEDRIAAVESLDSYLRGVIADSDDSHQIMVLTALRGEVGLLERVVRNHAFNKDSRVLAQVNPEATTDTVISHSHAEQNASTEDSSEQHGAAPENEETVNEQAQQEGPQYPGFYGQRV